MLREAAELLRETMGEQHLEISDENSHSSLLPESQVTKARLVEVLLYLGELDEARALMSEAEAVYAENVAPLGLLLYPLGEERHIDALYIATVRALLGVTREQAAAGGGGGGGGGDAMRALEAQVAYLRRHYHLGENRGYAVWAREMLVRVAANGVVV
jgi:hypothetical protein